MDCLEHYLTFGVIYNRLAGLVDKVIVVFMNEHHTG